MTRGHVVIAEGRVFSGPSVGADGVAIGEVVLNTAMTGDNVVVCSIASTKQRIPWVTTAQGGLAVVRSVASGPAAAAPVASLQHHHGNGDG